MNVALASKIMKAILDDVTDRRGWRQEWDDFDEDIQKEIKQTWIKIIMRCDSAAPSEANKGERDE